jgi:hypothetical protein
MVTAAGPVFTGRFEEFVINGESGEQYTIMYLADRNNQELQASGQPPSYYWMPGEVRLARKGDKGDFKFSHTHFVGVFDEDTNVGLGNSEAQFGLLNLTVTSRYPTEILAQAQDQLLQKFRGSSDQYWGWRSPVAPRFAIAPILANVASMSNVVPLMDGSVPPLPSGGSTEGPGGPGGPRRALSSRSELVEPRRVPHNLRGFRGPSAIDPWGFQLFGQGPASVTGGENAFSAVMGALPSEVIWTGFHGAYSPISISMAMQLQMWSQRMRVKITGNWDRIFEHFSAALNAKYLWFSADIKAEFNNLRISGGIKVTVDIDGTTPGADKMEEEINKRIDVIVTQFTEQAKQVIFTPAPQVQAAEASGGGGVLSSLFSYGGGLALKYRRDSAKLDLSYEEERYFRYIQPNTISSTLQGFYDEIKNDPTASQKYFRRQVLGGIGRKITRLVKPVVNWPDPGRNWAGDPVAFISAEVGYPIEDGSIEWKAHPFQRTDPPEASFNPAWVRWNAGEVSSPPPGWDPSMTFIRRRLHLMEPPGETDFPFLRVQIENNEIPLDPPGGTLGSEKIVEARADRAGVLEAGPIILNAILQSEAEMVEIEMIPKGTRKDGTDRSRNAIRFRWTFGDQNEPRIWKLFTGQPDFVPTYDYRVHVTVRGTIFTKGMAWSGPLVTVNGNGPIVIDVPTADSPGVVVRRLTPREMLSRDVVRAADGASVPPPADGAGPGRPGIGSPATGSPATGGDKQKAPAEAGAGGLGAPRTSSGIGAPRADRGAPKEDLSLNYAMLPTPEEPASRDVRTAQPETMPATLSRYAKELERAVEGMARRMDEGQDGKARPASRAGRKEARRPGTPLAEAEPGGEALADAWVEIPEQPGT